VSSKLYIQKHSENISQFCLFWDSEAPRIGDCDDPHSSLQYISRFDSWQQSEKSVDGWSHLETKYPKAQFGFGFKICDLDMTDFKIEDRIVVVTKTLAPTAEDSLHRAVDTEIQSEEEASQHVDDDQDQNEDPDRLVYSIVHGYRIPMKSTDQSQEMYKRILARQGLSVGEDEVSVTNVTAAVSKMTDFVRDKVEYDDVIGN
jgi:hypothetical protein